MLDSQPQPVAPELAANPGEHRYSLREPPRWLRFLLSVLINPVLFFTVSMLPRSIRFYSHPDQRVPVIVFLISIAALYGLIVGSIVWHFVRVKNERIVIGESQILWIGANGRERVRCALTDVTRWERSPTPRSGEPAYRVWTRKGDIWYTGNISRRAELDRLLIALTGEQIPDPMPKPRQWAGQASYRCTSGLALSLTTALLIVCAISTWLLVPRVPTWWASTDWGFLAVIVLFSAFLLANVCLESVTIAGRDLVCRNLLGSVAARVPLDDIESVDAGLANSAARIYTQTRTIRLDPMLKGYEELVYELQRLTASPNP